MKRSLLALAIGLVFGLTGLASADTAKPTAEKKAACCAAKSGEAAKACDREAKASCCSAEKGKANACCPGECCHKEKSAAPADKASAAEQKSAACCGGGSCCKTDHC